MSSLAGVPTVQNTSTHDQMCHKLAQACEIAIFANKLEGKKERKLLTSVKDFESTPFETKHEMII